jgi:hypothetical protein
MQDQLVRLKRGATFDEVRQRYKTTAEALASQDGPLRNVPAPIESADYVAQTAVLLREAMRLGFVERALVPSGRHESQVFRKLRYALTPIGRELAAHCRTPDFSERLSSELCRAHPYFRKLLLTLENAAIACPEIDDSVVHEARREHKGGYSWASYAGRLLHGQPAVAMPLRVVTDVTKRTLVSVRRRRASRDATSSSKSSADAINEAFTASAFAVRGMPFGVAEIGILKRWGLQLGVIDQSRHVPGYSAFNLIWLTADLVEGEQISVRHRRAIDSETKIANCIVELYRTSARKEARAFTLYLPIESIRTQVAFQCGVTRAVIDLVLERMSKGLIAEAPVQIEMRRSPRGESVSNVIEVAIHPKP